MAHPAHTGKPSTLLSLSLAARTEWPIVFRISSLLTDPNNPFRHILVFEQVSSEYIALIWMSKLNQINLRLGWWDTLITESRQSGLMYPLPILFFREIQGKIFYVIRKNMGVYTYIYAYTFTAIWTQWGRVSSFLNPFVIIKGWGSWIDYSSLLHTQNLLSSVARVHYGSGHFLILRSVNHFPQVLPPLISHTFSSASSCHTQWIPRSSTCPRWSHSMYACQRRDTQAGRYNPDLEGTPEAWEVTRPLFSSLLLLNSVLGGRKVTGPGTTRIKSWLRSYLPWEPGPPFPHLWTRGLDSGCARGVRPALGDGAP